MFGRRIELHFAKAPKTKMIDSNVPPMEPVDYAQIVHDTTETVAKYAAIGLAGYVALDTLRQVLVKLTPQH